MPSIQSAYQQAVLDARRLYLTELLPDVLEALVMEYASMIDLIARDMARGTITASRADALYLSILDRLEELAIRLGATYDEAAAEAMRIAIAGHQQGLAAAGDLAGRTVAASFATIPQQVIETMMLRRGLGVATTFRTLINRNIERLAGEVDAYLTSAVARGVSGRRGSIELAQILARDDRAVAAVLKTFNGSLSRAMRAGVPEDIVTRGRSLLFDARRIMVTETNTAYFEADRAAAVESPVVDLVFWQVSGRHYGLPSSPDVCTVYHEGDHHGYGPGLFNPQNVPAKPHPFCACYTLPQTREPGTWDDPKRPIPTPRTASEGQVERILEGASKRVEALGGTPRTITEKHLERQLNMTNDGLRFADEAARAVEVEV
jgi:hypothetical protein